MLLRWMIRVLMPSNCKLVDRESLLASKRCEDAFRDGSVLDARDYEALLACVFERRAHEVSLFVATNKKAVVEGRCMSQGELWALCAECAWFSAAAPSLAT